MLKKTQLVTAIGAAAGVSFAGIALADDNANPFQAEEIGTGSLSQSLAFDDHKEGKCGEEDKDKDKDADDKEGSCGEGSCGEGNCGEDHGEEGEDEEGSCGEGSCGEGSCGEA